MKVLLTLFIASAATVVNGFSVQGIASRQRRCATTCLYSEPSDTSSDSGSVFSIDTEPYMPTENESLVSSILDQVPALSEVNADVRSKINESLLKLEASNPTKNPATSPLLNGVWELRYASGYSPEWALSSPTRDLALFLYSGGYSPGLFALSLAQKLPSNLVDVGELVISISRQQPRVEATVGIKFFGGVDNEIVVKTKLDVMSDVRLKETYESASVLGRSINIPEQLQYARDLYVTYVDQDILVVRDASGVPEVLVRKEKTFSNDWGTEPSEVEDMSAPGLN